MSEWFDKRVTEHLYERSDPQIDIKVTLWRDSEGHGICALEAQNDRSQCYVADHRADIRAKLQKEFTLQEGFEIFEGQVNGEFSPSRENGLLRHGSLVKMEAIVVRAHVMLDIDWERQQNLAAQHFVEHLDGHER